MPDKPIDLRVETARRNLKMAAALRDMNLSEVSRQAGMSRNGLGQFTSGRTTLSYANMLRVCDVLRVPVGLIHRSDAITEGRIRLFEILERLPDHLAHKAISAAQEEMGSDD